MNFKVVNFLCKILSKKILASNWLVMIRYVHRLMVVLHVGVVGVVVVVAYPPQELGFVGDVGDRGQEPARPDGPLPDVVTSCPLREQARAGSEILK